MRKVLLFSALLGNIWERNEREGKNHSSEDNFQPYSSPQKSENPWENLTPPMSGAACQKIEMHKNHYYGISFFSYMTDSLYKF